MIVVVMVVAVAVLVGMVVVMGVRVPVTVVVPVRVVHDGLLGHGLVGAVGEGAWVGATVVACAPMRRTSGLYSGWTIMV